MNNTKITNYADDNTPYICDTNIDTALNILEVMETQFLIGLLKTFSKQMLINHT